jgi:hypothetical protein
MLNSIRRRLPWMAAAAACLLGAGAADAATSHAKLLKTYQPVTHFDPAETFLPTSVQSFIADAGLERLVAAPNTWAVVDPDPEPGDLPGPGTGIWRLNQEACSPATTLGGLACYGASWQEGHGAPVVYGHVAEQGDNIVLQYWYFYYDNTYSYAYPPSDFLWQAHEGDWEVVNVVLSSNEGPLYVGYSQHCLGQRRAWDTTPRFDETHPIVHVAVGSHSNYLSAGAHEFDVRCIPDPVLRLLQQLVLPLPRDVSLPGGAVAGPPQSGGIVSPIHEIDDGGPNWVDFPGFWGELQYFHVGPPAPVTITAALGTSPVGPAYHAVWNDPIGTIATWSVG